MSTDSLGASPEGLRIPRTLISNAAVRAYGKGSSFNSWLVLLFIAGCLIVIADGLTRTPVPEEGYGDVVQSLEYDSLVAAYIFAFASLPLCFLYASTDGASKEESLLLWFLLGTITYTKDFAYIHVPGLPIYITDLVLAFFVLSLISRRGLRWLPLKIWWARLLTLFIAVGVFSLVRGVVGGQEKLLALRDFAIVLYPMFLFVGLYFVGTWSAVRRVFIVCCLGTVLATLNGLTWFIAAPNQRRFIGYGLFVPAMLVVTVILTNRRVLQPITGWTLAAFLSIGVLLINARTVFVSLLLAFVLTLIISPVGRLRISARNLRVFAGLAVLVVLSSWAMSFTTAGAKFEDRMVTELASGTVGYADDPNAAFRFLAWLEALHRFGDHPLVGEGFGVPFTFEYADYDPRPHNTYITVLYKMGTIGIIPLIALLFLLHRCGWNVLRNNNTGTGAAIVYALMFAQIIMMVFGLLNLLLESPFLASVFWLVFGLTLRATTLVRIPVTSQSLALRP